MNILVTICARGGSKGLPSKNIHNFLGKPLIAYTVELAKAWPFTTKLVVSTDSEEIAKIAIDSGAEAPFMRPAELATDSAGKLPVIIHALEQSEKTFGQKFDVVMDLDPTSPVRRIEDIEQGHKKFLESNCQVCFSVVKARKNPYFNMVERDPSGKIKLVKELSTNLTSRQAAPQVWDMNASIYFFKRDFLLEHPKSIWSGKSEIFEMPPESAFDIDQKRDLIIAEALMKHFILNNS